MHNSTMPSASKLPSSPPLSSSITMLGPSYTRTTQPKAYLSNCLNHRSLQTANALPQMLNCMKINENNRECLFIFAASMMTEWMTFECHAFVNTVSHSMFQVQS
jgi:hypothetical protein